LDKLISALGQEIAVNAAMWQQT
jgi:hypothetical protein